MEQVLPGEASALQVGDGMPLRRGSVHELKLPPGTAAGSAHEL